MTPPCGVPVSGREELPKVAVVQWSAALWEWHDGGVATTKIFWDRSSGEEARKTSAADSFPSWTPTRPRTLKQDSLESLRARLRQDKALAYLLSKANFT